MLTIKQVAKQLNVSAATVYGWVGTGCLTCYRLGARGRRGAIRVAESDLAALLESLRTKKGQQTDKPTAPKTAKPKSAFRHITL
jgi:excisionase family DNA binding protein